jgi:predicted HNH restriction endonuclease
MGAPQHHHIVFRSRGGLNVAENLITVCGSCHADIHDGRVFVTGTASYLTVTSGRGLSA